MPFMDGLLLLEQRNFVARFATQAANNLAVLQLHALAVAEPPADEADAVEWLGDLVDWIFEGGPLFGGPAGASGVDARTRLLLTAAEEIGPFALQLREALATALSSGSATFLFTDTGIPSHFGFWRESIDRVARRLLPTPPVHGDVARLLARLFDSPARAEWVRSMPEQTRARLSDLLGLQTDTWTQLWERGAREAAVVLSARIAMQGVSDDLRVRLPAPPVAGSPFLLLPAAVNAALHGRSPPGAAHVALAGCRAQLREVAAGLHLKGISIDLVFRLELLAVLLTRLSQLMNLLTGLEEARELAVVQLERELLRGSLSDRSLGALWQGSTRLLARRVVERAGTSGEHYLTTSRSEQQAMLFAAAGGGAVTAVMVLTKFFVAAAHPPPFFDALLVGLNYAWGFVAMQLMHFALATKQPAMTAATLAGAIEAQRDERPDLEPLVDLVARASRTQFTALLGNVFVVIPFALILATFFEATFGRHVIDARYAERIVSIHHPVFSATLFSATLTGVWLWASSLLAGAAENYFVLRELPGAIATHRGLRRWLGASRAARLSRFLSEQVGAFGGNVGFGLLLGFMPMLFVLVGLPLEVRHVTFVTGQLTYAAHTLGPAALGRPDFLVALLSIPLVGLINFAVSFAFAIVVALRARGLGVRDQLSLARAVWARFQARPRSFFLAPAEPVSVGPPEERAKASR